MQTRFSVASYPNAVLSSSPLSSSYDVFASPPVSLAPTDYYPTSAHSLSQSDSLANLYHFPDACSSFSITIHTRKPKCYTLSSTAFSPTPTSSSAPWTSVSSLPHKRTFIFQTPLQELLRTSKTFRSPPLFPLTACFPSPDT